MKQTELFQDWIVRVAGQLFTMGAFCDYISCISHCLTTTKECLFRKSLRTSVYYLILSAIFSICIYFREPKDAVSFCYSQVALFDESTINLRVYRRESVLTPVIKGGPIPQGAAQGCIRPLAPILPLALLMQEPWLAL